MKRIWVWILVLALLSACVPTPAAQSAPAQSTVLSVYAAASLTSAFTEIGHSFEAAHPGVAVRYNFAGSQTLRAQIEQGAQVDVFASANAIEMDALAKGGYLAADGVKTLLTNRLTVILPAQNHAGVLALADLAKPGVKIILAAKEVPAGSYALQVLDRLDQIIGGGYKANVLANTVSYENDVKQVVTKVRLGEADAGIVYASDAVAAPEVQTIEIPDASNVVAKYPIAALAQSKHADLASAFVAYTLSAEGQAILKKWGFSPAQ